MQLVLISHWLWIFNLYVMFSFGNIPSYFIQVSLILEKLLSKAMIFFPGLKNSRSKGLNVALKWEKSKVSKLRLLVTIKESILTINVIILESDGGKKT